MGVPGLWELLRPAAARTSLSTLARDGFAVNNRGLRAYTIGIDASLWIFHAQLPQHGENPFMRTIFFKLTTLLQQPILPVFVFDGPQKPRMKRGARVAGKFGTHDRRSVEFKRLLDECGLAYWNAPGEAEAELALMNRQGKVDAVLSDDGDALLFGAKCLIRNNSATLSGTRASQHVSSTKGDLKTYEVFRADAICAVWAGEEGTALQTEEDCRLAMVWIALLAGGDYVPEGIETFGHKIAYGLAKAGMSTELQLYTTDQPAFASALPSLQQRMIHELRTNSTGQIGRKNPARANSLSAMAPEQLFNLEALEAYTRPKTSGSDPANGWPGFIHDRRQAGTSRNGGRGDMEGLARACERFFEWGTRDLVVKRFVSESVGTFGAEIIQAARQRVIDRDELDRPAKSASGPAGRLTSYFQVTGPSSQPSKVDKIATPTRDTAHPDYIVKIERTRPDPTNPDLTEYRIQYTTDPFVKRVHDAMTGSRVDPKNLSAGERSALGMRVIEQDEEDDDLATVKADKGLSRLWIADWLVQEAWPELVKQWEEAETAKAKPKGKAGSHSRSASSSSARGKKGLQADGEDANRFASFFGSQASGTGYVPQPRSFRRTTSAPSASSHSRTLGTQGPTAGRSALPPVSEDARASPCDALTTGQLPPASSFFQPKPRSFGRTTSVPVTSAAHPSLPASSFFGASKSTSPGQWPIDEAMFVDSDDDFPPLDAVPEVEVEERSTRRSPTKKPAKRVDKPSTAGIVPGSAEIIDLCDSSEQEEEEPIEEKPARSGPGRKTAASAKAPPRILRTSSRENSQPPASNTQTRSKTQSRAGANTLPKPKQATLAFPVTAPVQTATPQHKHHVPLKQAARFATTPTPTKIQPKKGRKSYVVEEEDSDVEVIDSTRGGVNLAGYGYNK